MPIVDDDCGSIVNCLSLKFMLMNFHIDLSIRVNGRIYVCVCLAYWRSQSAMQQPQEKKREIITAKKNIKYNLISRYAKILIYPNCIKTGRGRCSARIYWNYPYKLGEGCHQLVSLEKGCQLLANFARASVKSRCCPTWCCSCRKNIWNSIQKCSILSRETPSLDMA